MGKLLPSNPATYGYETVFMVILEGTCLGCGHTFTANSLNLPLFAEYLI